jgi:hypothetical protein
MAALIAEALKTAKSANAPALEAYPVDTAQAQHVQRVHRYGFHVQAPGIQDRRSPLAVSANHAP